MGERISEESLRFMLQSHLPGASAANPDLCGCNRCDALKDLREARAEIERLKAEREAAQNTHAMYGRENSALRARNERLERAYSTVRESLRGIHPLTGSNLLRKLKGLEDADVILHETEEPS